VPYLESKMLHNKLNQTVTFIFAPSQPGFLRVYSRKTCVKRQYSMTKMNKYCPRVNCVAVRCVDDLLFRSYHGLSLGPSWIDTLFEAHL